MKIGWYLRLDRLEKEDLSEYLSNKIKYHPGSLLFAPQEEIAELVRRYKNTGLFRTLTYTCVDCGALTYPRKCDNWHEWQGWQCDDCFIEDHKEAIYK